jgi:hypothetical protein
MEFRASRQIEDPMQNIDGIGVFWCKSATAKPVIAKSNVDAAGVTAFSSSGS